MELLSLLRSNADFRRLYLSTVVSFAGDWFAFVAAAGMVADHTGGGGLVAVLYAANVLPVFLMSFLAGAAADRMNRKTLFVLADAARVLPALGMVGALRLGSPALMIGCTALVAGLSAFSEPIHAAVVPNLVRGRQLSLAQAALSGVWGSMLFVGAALGGLLATWLGREATFLANAATFLCSALLILRIRTPLQGEYAARRLALVADLKEVWALARTSATSRALLTSKVGVGLANGIVGLLPAFAVTQFRGGDTAVGLFLGARGLGALAGPFVGRRLAREDGRRLLLVCGISIIAYGIAYAFLPLASSLALAVTCVAAAHVGGGAQWAMSTYGLQRTTPDGLRGRVMSIDFGLATLAIGVSSLFAGALSEGVGLWASAWAMTALAVTYGAVWLVSTRALWRKREDPLQLSAPRTEG